MSTVAISIQVWNACSLARAPGCLFDETWCQFGGSLYLVAGHSAGKQLILRRFGASSCRSSVKGNPLNLGSLVLKGFAVAVFHFILAVGEVHPLQTGDGDAQVTNLKPHCGA